MRSRSMRRNPPDRFRPPGLAWRFDRKFRAIWPELGEIAPKAAAQIEIDAKYAVYLDRQTKDIEAFRHDEALTIPEDVDYALLPGLSSEIRARLDLIRPRTMGQAGQIEGMTPAAMTFLAAKLRRAGTRS